MNYYGKGWDELDSLCERLGFAPESKMISDADLKRANKLVRGWN